MHTKRPFSSVCFLNHNNEQRKGPTPAVANPGAILLRHGSRHHDNDLTRPPGSETGSGNKYGQNASGYVTQRSRRAVKGLGDWTRFVTSHAPINTGSLSQISGNAVICWEVQAAFRKKQQPAPDKAEPTDNAGDGYGKPSAKSSSRGVFQYPD